VPCLGERVVELTFRSLWVEGHTSRESAEAPYRLESPHDQLFTLNAFTFPKSLAVFARDSGLILSYVDNAWLRVSMKGSALKQFITLGLATEVKLTERLAVVDTDHWYVVNEEEF
jgi:hypothetical protein